MILSRDFVYSPLNLPGHYQPKLSSWWQDTTDKEVDSLYLENRRNLGMLSFDAIYMGDGNLHNFQVLLRDEKHHNFYIMNQQKIYPRKCSLVVDSRTEDSVNSWSKVLRSNKTEDMCFEFLVNRIEGCDDEYENTLQS